jgi:hypothetical protein
MIEVTRAGAWLYGVLAGDLVLAPLVGTRIHRHPAPAGTTFPAITFAHQGGGDRITQDGNRVLVSCVFAVHAICEGDSNVPIEPIADRIDYRLHQASGETTDARVLSCIREQVLDLPTREGERQYQQIISTYRILVQSK